MTMGHIFGFSPGLLPVYFLYFMLIYPAFAQEDTDQTIKEHKIIVNKTLLGEDATLICSAKPAGVKLEWQLKEKPLKNSDRIKINSSEDGTQTTLLISHTTKDDRGNYSCIASTEKQKETKVELLELPFLGEFVVTNDSYVEIDRGKTVQLKCTFKMYYKPDNVTWSDPKSETEDTTVTALEDNRYISTRNLKSVSYGQHNGVHTCTAFDKVNGSFVTGNVTLMVRDEPLVTLGHHLGIGKHQIYLNWTVEPRNSKINNYLFQIDTEYHSKPVEPNATSLILFDLKPNKTYTIKMSVQTMLDNELHQTQGPSVNVTTLVEDPVFVPNISINGFSATSVTVGWHAPPKEIEKFIHYYLLEARKKDEEEAPRKAYHSRDFRNLPYMFDNLKPYSTYLFKARACSDYTKECGAWSEEMPAATLDGIPGEPSKVDINCTSNLMYLSWQPPDDPRAEIKGYTMELTGFAEYKDRSGHMKKETWGPLSRFKGNESRIARFDDLQPNTNYTVRLSAMTRSRRRGEEASTSCFTSAALPDLPPRPRWRKILDNNKYLFKVFLPKVSERNGPICCYRVHVVRMPPNADLKSLKPQANMAIISYEEAHQDPAPLGSYITDIFSNNNFPKDSEFVIGDENYIFNQSETTLKLPSCLRCIKRPRPIPTTPATKLAPATTTEDDLLDDVTAEPTENKRERRSVDDGSDYSKSPTMSDSPSASLQDIAVKDGPLVSQFNYTVFVELIPLNVGDQILEPIYSDYLNILMPAPSAVAPAPSTALEIALQATCGVAALVLLLMVVFCVLQSRRSRKLPPHGHLEMGRLPPVFRFFWPTLGGRQALSSAAPPDMPPIARADLPAAYAERHADSDLGFQKEFELLQMLSECFPDRTTHASEARENQPKNRYPDIKAYDQTRVKLSQIDGITGSDYINANYVMGYKERKKFICAQGPTDTTVNDFWRMMWEHGLELIVMLTNLEEYSKVKCSKYWPDEARGSRAFGTINVRRVSETRYSDYIVRELKISKLPTNADGQPIVENNGVAKRNGDIGKQESVEGSAPTSPREGAEERTVRQYHYLTWRDFAAPEHPHCILKFIKRVNEAWTNMVGRPVVVHCSAGVGRTGTLVALDCLLEQLRATGQVAVFNTIAELRRQRNFLVQSQKQYVFVYRALVEYAHYGDTEIPAARLKTAIDRLRNTPEGADKCLMEHEFEKMIEAPVVEPVKSCAAGQAEEVRNKNRSQDCLPYDRNRVMLTPIPGRDYSTYINASFVEAYDNSEGFIITQDPLPTTIFDFWRMVSEQSVSTIVMLSELGEGKCPRYWDDGTAQYEHMSVVYDESESCPYYTRRQFRLTNTKTGHTQSVRQLQYQGWPTAPGHVPEVTRGLAELADAAAVSAGGDSLGPMVVHCNNGTERSALFVALCVLICQLRSERRVDVNAVARKVRSQRQLTIHTVLQYEFLHRAILNYAELHNLLEDS